jgi:hypothetical protein
VKRSSAFSGEVDAGSSQMMRRNQAHRAAPDAARTVHGSDAWDVRALHDRIAIAKLSKSLFRRILCDEPISASSENALVQRGVPPCL